MGFPNKKRTSAFTSAVQQSWRSRPMRSTPIRRAPKRGAQLLQFLLVVFSERIRTTSPVWSVRVGWDRPGLQKLGGPCQPLEMILSSQ